MSKKCYRFFGGLMVSQANWLNKMSSKGYRLIRTEKLLYEFEECTPGQYQYCVEFIGHKSKENAADYVSFLENFGYHVFFKNINLDWNVGKVEVRPWTEKGGRIATNNTTFNRELLIIEKENDGKPFELHTTYEDKADYYKKLRKPWIYMFLMYAVLGIAFRSLIWAIFAFIPIIGLIIYQIELSKLNKNAKSKEW